MSQAKALPSMYSKHTVKRKKYSAMYRHDVKTYILNCSWSEVTSEILSPFCLLTLSGMRHIRFSTGTEAERN